jgi:hypothetical protein
MARPVTSPSTTLARNGSLEVKTHMRAVVQAILNDPLVKADVGLLKLPEGYSVWIDPWPRIKEKGEKNRGGSLK